LGEGQVDAIAKVAEPLEPPGDVGLRQVANNQVQDFIRIPTERLPNRAAAAENPPHPHLHDDIIRTYVRSVKDFEPLAKAAKRAAIRSSYGR
jgi:hypothetical protein